MVMVFREFSTPRLIVTAWDEDVSDLGRFQRLCSELAVLLQPEVMWFLPPSMQVLEGQTDIARWVTDLASGAAVSVVRSREAGALVGLLILDVPELDAAQIRIGYLLGKDVWGQGLASELVAGFVGALKASAFTGLVTGGVESGNPASVRVLQKAGFEISPETIPDGVVLALRVE